MRGRQERPITAGAGEGGPSTAGGRRAQSRAAAQLNVPASPTTTGADLGDDMMPPSSQHGAAAGAQAGSQAGAPQAGAMGESVRPDEQGERNSMKEGRRQELPPKQLLHPGAANRLPTTIARHTVRDMIQSPPLPGRGPTRQKRCAVRDDAFET
ncbi:MAG: hypothetical protein EBZ59_08780 [Planctomycetia bacterium]|nr:hypothetical protein [Planctomycetia bacterium]